jgi:hypothetical protein
MSVKSLKLLTIIAFLFSMMLAASTPVLAEPATLKDRADAMKDDQPLNLDKYSNENFGGITAAAGINITGYLDENGKPVAYGAIPMLGKGITFLATRPPVMTSEYVADVIHNTGFAPQAYAQGIGFSGLSPVLVVWKAFRNISYFLLVIVFVVIGFMIMFRAQINPQTVVTIQTALPQIVITLILITFSYAIAGFVVDLIYLLIFLATEIFMFTDILASPDGATQAQNAIFGYSIFRVGLKFFLSPFEAAGSAANSVSAVVQGLFGLPGILDFIIDSLAYLIIAVAMLIAFFRTFFGLLMAYIGIIMATIFAPFQLLLNAFPGSNAFNQWIRGLAANAAVFPAVAIMLIVGAYLVGGEDTNPPLGISESGQTNGWGQEEGSGFIPPLITTRGGDFWDQDNEEFGVEHMRSIIGLGIIMLLPEVVKLVKGAMGVEDKGIGDLVTANLQRGSTPVTGVVGAPFRAVGGTVGAVGRYAQTYAGIAALDKLGEAAPGIRKFTSPITSLMRGKSDIQQAPDKGGDIGAAGGDDLAEAKKDKRVF